MEVEKERRPSLLDSVGNWLSGRIAGMSGAEAPAEKEAAVVDAGGEAEVVAAAAAVAGGASKPGRVAAGESAEQILRAAGRAALDALSALPGRSWRDLAALPEVRP